jgi:hypothetical protein
MTEEEAAAEVEAAAEREEEEQLLLEAKRMEAEGHGKGVFNKVKRKLAQRKARKMRLVRGDALQYARGLCYRPTADTPLPCLPRRVLSTDN